MARTTDITSFTDHRKHLREHLDRIRESGRPMYITTNGRTDAVVLSPEAYDALAGKAELVESLQLIERSMEEVRAGRGLPYHKAIRSVAEELGLTLEDPNTVWVISARHGRQLPRVDDLPRDPASLTDGPAIDEP